MTKPTSDWLEGAKQFGEQLALALERAHSQFIAAQITKGHSPLKAEFLWYDYMNNTHLYS